MGPPPAPHLPPTSWPPALLLMLCWLVILHSGDAQHVLGTGTPSPNETDMDLQYEKQDESDCLLVKFCKFKFEAFAHYKVNQREQ